ncbi:class I SAM-dependent methyltransferase [Rhodococcus spelaei]|uniref:Class I SAM-dependent methyltransferase n=2 Tax=Rhodococcus spelaei TaxID=2546320 RepID=A0A541B815_9NOCA|nr:class I SAM-dependent methyltransferase [Rhodococcus spelaei]
MPSGRPYWVATAGGPRRSLPTGRWLGGDASTTADRFVDELLVRACTGPTIDLGCGPGRFTASLSARGIAALGVDNSAAAVDMTVRRGGIALHRDLFAPLPGCGGWNRVLLADGNIGIAGDPVRVLRRAHQLLAPRGLVIAEIDSPQVGIRRERVRWETDHSIGTWYPWARVGAASVGMLAEAAGLRVVESIEACGRFIVAMLAD